jgi:chromosome segregation ATPase
LQDRARVAELEDKLAAIEASNENLIAANDKLESENEVLKGTRAEIDSDIVKMGEQYETLLEQTNDLMGDKIRTTTNLPHRGYDTHCL